MKKILLVGLFVLISAFLLGKYYKTRDATSFPSRDKFSQMIAQNILNIFSEESVEFISSFAQGMEDCENGVNPYSFQEYVKLMMTLTAAKTKWENTSLDSDFAEYRAINLKVAHQFGIRTWNHLRYGKEWYSLTEICEHLLSGKKEISPDYGKTDAMFTHLHWHLYFKKQNLPRNSEA